MIRLNRDRTLITRCKTQLKCSAQLRQYGEFHNSTWGRQRDSDSSSWETNSRDPNRPHPFWKRVFPDFHRQPYEDEINDFDRNPAQYYDFDAPRAIHRKGARARRCKRNNWLELYDWTVHDWKKKDTPNYLKLTDEQMRIGCIGYLSEDDESDPTRVKEFSIPYNQAPLEYRKEVLADKCLGRPSYEWQIPFGIDEIFGYHSLITAPDVMGNPQARANMQFSWVNKGSDPALDVTNILLENPETGQTLTIVSSNNGDKALKTLQPDTAAFQWASDKVLNTLDYPWSATSFADQRGCLLALGWTYVFVHSAFFPVTVPAQVAAYSLLSACNFHWIRKTYFEKDDWYLKMQMKTCRKQQCRVIFGDWLEEDFDERYFHTRHNDAAAKGHGNHSEWQPKSAELMNYISNTVANSPLNIFREKKSPDAALSPDFPNTYRDAINLRRLDIFAHSLNSAQFAWLNPDPEEQDPSDVPKRMLAVVRDTDDIPAATVMKLVAERMTGEVECTNPFKFTEEHDRLEIVF